MSEELHYAGRTTSYKVPTTEEVLYKNAILAVHGYGPGSIVELDPVADPDPEATIIREILQRGIEIWGASFTQREPDPHLYPNPTAEDFVRIEEEDRQDTIARQEAIAREKQRWATAPPKTAKSVKRPPAKPEPKTHPPSQPKVLHPTLRSVALNGQEPCKEKKLKHGGKLKAIHQNQNVSVNGRP